MKKGFEKTNVLIARIALQVTKANVNSTCGFLTYQPKLPDSAHKLKKPDV